MLYYKYACGCAVLLRPCCIILFDEEVIMKRIMHVVVAAMAAFVLSGCVYSHVLTPYDTDLNKTVLGQKQGKASMESVLWLIAWGDASTSAAAKQGGLTTVNHMDREALFVLFGLYTKTTTIVYGD
jgi:hypothetical protein